ncbi:MAG: hypothetical protein LBP53_08215 [Candidatus Peribacteria bacterium]|jgi:hypothetical protein|nr:hypothetical protein [Candidatus Peribacteria bacterium]
MSITVIIGGTVLILGGFFIFLLFAMPHKNFFNLYLLVISLVATLGFTISAGLLVNELLQYQLMDTQTYAQQQWQYLQCSQEGYTYKEDVDAPKTEAEIQVCEKKAIDTVADQREYRYRDNLISFCTWVILFLVL